MRERGEGGSKASKMAAKLLVTKFRDKSFSYSQQPTFSSIKRFAVLVPAGHEAR